MTLGERPFRRPAEVENTVNGVPLALDGGSTHLIQAATQTPPKIKKKEGTTPLKGAEVEHTFLHWV